MRTNARPVRTTRPVLTPLARAAAQLLSAAGLLATPLVLQAQALPTGLQIVQGQASVATQGAQMTVRNSPSAILNWQSFSIGAANQVRFEQASSASKVLNRVTGNDPSQIFGSLTSNGQVWLLNPNGVLFGQGARVDVAGLVASTLRLNDNDFLRGLYRFNAPDGDRGLVRNEGAMTAMASSNGGQIVLLGSRVENAGSIDAAGGSIALAAGRSVELVDTGLPYLSVKVDIPAGEVLNLGRLQAPGGKIDVYGAIVNQQGLVQADSLGPDAQGRIVLKASDTLTLGDSSRTQAQGLRNSAGGSIDLLGDKVALVGTAQVDASGDAGGGSVRVGGGLQGLDTSVSNASAVFFGPDASIRADASGAHGEGGRIILWSDLATRAYGHLSARGGSLTGNGGFVETSGGWLDARPVSVDVGATAGLAGSWLLDPNNLLFNNTGPNSNIGTGPNFTTTGDSAVIGAPTVASALNAGTSVIITTGTGGSNAQAGDIVVSGVNLNVSPAVGVGLTLRANRDILITNSSISSAAAPLTINLVSATGGVKGVVEIRNSSITTAGGNLTLGGATALQQTLPGGVFTAQTYAPAIGYDSSLDTLGTQLSYSQYGVLIRNNTVLSLGAGTFSATGRGAATSDGKGVSLGGAGSTVTLTAANIVLNGFGDSTVPSSAAPGVEVIGNNTGVTATQSISMFGAGAQGVLIGQGARVTLNAPGNAAALFKIEAWGRQTAASILDASLSSSPLYQGTPVRVIGGRFELVGVATDPGFGIQLSGAGYTSTGQPTAPSLDLASAAGGSITASRSGSDIYLNQFNLATPANGTLAFASQGLVYVDNSRVAGAGTLNLSGRSLTVSRSTIAASGLLNLGFATTGSSPTGLTIDNSTLATGGGDVRFGNLQQVCSPALGCSTVDGYWLQAGGSFGADPLAIQNSSINAGSGRIYGGGAVLASSNTSQGVYVSNSTLTAKQIFLAGNSESNNGVQIAGSTLTANQVLKLDGLTGATSGFASGVYLPSANTLRVNASFDDPDAKLSILGETRGPGGGVQVYGGEPSTNSQTLISTTGADLLLRGTAPADHFGLAMDGSSAAAGALNIVGATNRTMELSGSGAGAYLSRLRLAGSGTVNMSGTGVNLSEVTVAAQNGPLNIAFATTGTNLRGVSISRTDITTQGGFVRFGAVQTVCTTSLGCTTSPAPWLEAEDRNAIFIGDSTITAGAGSIFGGGSQRGAAPNNDSVSIVSSTLSAASIALKGRAEGNNGINTGAASLIATQSLTLDGISGAATGSGSGLYLSTGTRLSVNDPNNQPGSLLSLIGESRGSGTGLLVYGGDAASNGQSVIEATGANLSMRATGTGSFDGLYLASLFGPGGLVISIAGGRTADLSAFGGGNYFDEISFRGAGTLNIAGPNTSLFETNITAVGGLLNVGFATTGANPGGVDISGGVITTGGGDVRFGALQQVCSPGLGCTTGTDRYWLESGGSGSYGPLVLSEATIEAGSGRIYGGGSAREPVSQSPGVGLYGNRLSAAEIDLAGRADNAEGLRMLGGMLTATRKLTLDGLSASTQGYESGLAILAGSTVQVLDPNSSAGSALTLNGVSRGAGAGLQASGDSTSGGGPTLIKADGAELRMSGTSQTGVGMQLFESNATSTGGLRIDAAGASLARLSGQTSAAGAYGLLMQQVQLTGPAAGTGGADLQLAGTGSTAGSQYGAYIVGSSITSGSPLVVAADGLYLANSTVAGSVGVSLLRAASPAVTSPVLIQASTISTSAAGADIVIGTEGGAGGRGRSGANGGRGIDIQNSTLQASGTGSRIAMFGTGSSAGGSGVYFTGAQMQASGISISGTGTSNADGVLSDAGTSTGVTTSVLRATDLNISGRSDNGDGTAPQYVGVRLGSAVELALTGRGNALIRGDTVALGSISAVAQNFKAAGDAASFSVDAANSMRVRNSTLDFGGGAGTTLRLAGDADGLAGGRVRLESSTVNSGGGNLTVTGVGVLRGSTSFAPPNSALGDGATGVYLAASTVNAGSGAVLMSGMAPNDGTASADSAGNLGLATFSGTTAISARSITLTGSAGDRGIGIAVGTDQNGNLNNSVLNLTAETITVSGLGVGVTPGTDPLPYAGLLVTGASTWRALNGGGLSISSVGATQLTGVTFSAGTLGLSAAGALTLSGSSLSATGPVTATATGTALERGTFSIGTGTLAAGGRLRVSADGISLLPGAALSSAATGDAIVLSVAGPTGNGAFANTAGANVLSTPNGRWVLLLGNPNTTALGGLTPAFTSFGLGQAPWLTDADGNFITPQPGNALGYGAGAANLVLVSGLLTKVYDGSNSITLDPQRWVITGLTGGDTLTLSGSTVALLDSKNVGTGKTVTLSAANIFTVLDAGGRPVFGYAAPTFTANVTAAPLAVAGLTAANKVYDAGTLATLLGSATVTPFAGDSVAVSAGATGQFANKNVGTGKAVSVSGMTLTGADAGNYQLVAPTGLTANITPLAVNVTGLNAASKVYDATAAATLTGTASVVALAGDSLGVSGSATARFADKNVGTAKPVTISGSTYGLTGADAGNYTLQLPTGFAADISRAPLNVTGLTVAGKVYDGNTAAAVSGTPVISPLAGDSVTLGSGSASFADKNVGTAKPVSLSGYALTGADAGNYTLSVPTGLAANISPALLTLSGIVVANKSYDGTTNAALTGAPTFNALAGDSVTLGSGSASFADKNVGTAKPVSLSGYALTGADAGNYTLSVPTGLTANISPALLTLGGLSAASRPYDGTANASASATLGGVLSGESVNLTLAASFADKNVGTAKPVSYSAQLAGSGAGNYTLGTAASGSLGASITPLTLSYVADPQASNQLSPLPLLTGSVTGFLTGETLASATTGTLRWTTPATPESPAGSYAINGTGLTAVNYTFTQAAGNATALTQALPLRIDLGPENNTTTNNTTVGVAVSLLSVQVPVQMSTPTAGRVLDAVPALASSSTPTLESTDGSSANSSANSNASGSDSSERATTQAAADGRAGEGGPPSGVTFRSMNFQRMPRDEIQTVLAARAGFKKQVFATGVFKLEQDPTLADVRGCRSAAELSAGNCLITEQLKKEMQAAAQAQPRRAQRKVKQTALPRIERKLALLIGVNKYKDQRVPELVGAVPDARAVKALLEQRLGYEATVVEDPSREAIVRAFNKLALEAEPNDSVIIYYAGHGVVVPMAGVDTGFWLPSDSNAEEPSTWLSNADIARLVTAVGAKQLMLVSDSCYSGSLAGSERVQLEGQVTDPSELLNRKAVVVMSSGGNEPVADEGREGHSIFAWHLMQSLKGLDSWQVGGSVFERVRTAVAKEFPQTPQYGAQRSAGHQGNTDYLFERREFEPAATN